MTGAESAIRSAGALILAAGEASRAKGPKAVWPIADLPSVRRVALAALEAETVSETVVVIGGPWADEVEAALMGLPLEIALNPDYAQGQSSSLKAGLGLLDPSLDTVVFLLADQPFLTSQILDDLLKFHWMSKAGISAPVLAGRRRNPVAFDLKRFRGDLLDLKGDIGGREVIAAHPGALALWPVENVPAECFADFDTAEEYERLKK